MTKPSVAVYDGEVLLEWIHDEYRFAIALDPEGRHSWYLVIKDGVMESGWMNEELKEHLNQLRKAIMEGRGKD